MSNTNSFSISLAGADVELSDGVNATIVLTERQRELALRISSQPGGDGGQCFRVEARCIKDIEQVPNLEQQGIHVVEVEDGINPTFSSMTLNYRQMRELLLTASETIPTGQGAIDLSKLFFC